MYVCLYMYIYTMVTDILYASSDFHMHQETIFDKPLLLHLLGTTVNLALTR